jgi:hypothetical protein
MIEKKKFAKWNGSRPSIITEDFPQNSMVKIGKSGARLPFLLLPELLQPLL